MALICIVCKQLREAPAGDGCGGSGGGGGAGDGASHFAAYELIIINYL